MYKLSEAKPESRFFGLFVGDSKSGKSGEAATWLSQEDYDAGKRILVYDFDLRAKGIAGCKHFIPHFDRVDIDAYPPNRPLYRFIKDLNIKEKEFLERKCNYATIILDSITSNSRFFLSDAMELTGGRMIGGEEVIIDGKKTFEGGIRVSGPPDHNIKDQAIYRVFDFIRTFPCNVIVTAHIVNKWGKLPGAPEYSDNVIIGEQLSITDKLAANILIYFSEVYKFKREEQTDGKLKYFVKFRGDLLGTAYKSLPNGFTDITDKNLYNFWREKLAEEK